MRRSIDTVLYSPVGLISPIYFIAIHVYKSLIPRYRQAISKYTQFSDLEANGNGKPSYLLFPRRGFPLSGAFFFVKNGGSWKKPDGKLRKQLEITQT